MDQLREERDEALALLQRVEASRNDLARQQGQYKGRIAKVTSILMLSTSLSEPEGFGDPSLGSVGTLPLLCCP